MPIVILLVTVYRDMTEACCVPISAFPPEAVASIIVSWTLNAVLACLGGFLLVKASNRLEASRGTAGKSLAILGSVFLLLGWLSFPPGIFGLVVTARIRAPSGGSHPPDHPRVTE